MGSRIRRQEPRKFGPGKAFLLWCSGVRRDVLARSPTEDANFVGLGGAVLTTAVFATVSSSAALAMGLDQPVRAMLPFGIAWGLAIFNLDRWLVATATGRGLGAIVRTFLPRLALAVTLAFVIAEPLLLAVFDPEIQAKMVELRTQDATEQREEVTEKYAPRLDEVTARVDDLQARVDEQEAKVRDLDTALIGEIEGSSGTGVPGDGPVSREKRRSLAEEQQVLETLRADLDDARVQQQKIEQDRAAEIRDAERTIGADSGLLRRIKALDAVTGDNTAAAAGAWLLRLVIVLLDSLPVLVKLLQTLTGPRSYERLLNALQANERLHADVVARRGELTAQLDADADQRVHDTELRTRDYHSGVEAAQQATYQRDLPLHWLTQERRAHGLPEQVVPDWWHRDLAGGNGHHPTGTAAPARLEAEEETEEAAVRPERHPVRVGRAPGNDLVLDDPLVSGHHTTVYWDGEPGEYRIADHHSHTGVFVGGQRVTGDAPLHDGDTARIGHHTLRLTDGVLKAEPDAGGDDFVVRGCTVRLDDGRVLVDDVSFALPAGSFLAVVGPTGAGKTTLLKAMTGLAPADTGHISYGGRDLYAEYDELRLRIGYIPQDDVLHPELRVRQALRFAAQLRFPSDMPPADRDARVDAVLEELRFTHKADQRVSTLSGGERKRVNVAMELLTRPSLLFADEPASSLDAGHERTVMKLLRRLADGGRTVVVVTHNVQSLTLCDRVLFLAPGGQTAYFGPPEDALAYFGATGHAEIFNQLQADQQGELKQRFLDSPEHARYVQPALDSPTAAQALPLRPVPLPRQPRSWSHQFATLVRRYLAVMVADRRNLLLLLAQAPVLALLTQAVVGDGGLAAYPEALNPDARKILFALVFTITMLGAVNAVREIVKERAIYRRERAVGLLASAYLASKLTVLTAVVVLHSVVLIAIILYGRDGPETATTLGSPLLELTVAIVLAGVAAMTLGLLASALVDRADKALTLVPLLLIPQFLFAGAFFDLHVQPVLRPASWVTSAHWGYAAAASTVDLRRVEPMDCGDAPAAAAPAAAEAPDEGAAPPADAVPAVGCAEPWEHTRRTWASNVLALCTLIGLGVLGAAAGLRRQDPGLLSSATRDRTLWRRTLRTPLSHLPVRARPFPAPAAPPIDHARSEEAPADVAGRAD